MPFRKVTEVGAWWLWGDGNWRENNAHIFKRSSTGDLYVLWGLWGDATIDGTTIAVWKSTDDGKTWTKLAAEYEPEATATRNAAWACHQEGDKIHMVYTMKMPTGPSWNHGYTSFDLSTDSFQGSKVDILTASDIYDFNPRVGGAALFQRSNGDLVAVLCDAHGTGPDGACLKWTKSTDGGANWTTPADFTSTETTGAHLDDWTATLDTSTGRLHAWFHDDTFGDRQTYHRSMSSADVWDTTVAMAAGNANWELWLHAVNDGAGTVGWTETVGGMQYEFITSQANPTFSGQTALSTINDTSYSSLNSRGMGQMLWDPGNSTWRYIFTDLDVLPTSVREMTWNGSTFVNERVIFDANTTYRAESNTHLWYGGYIFKAAIIDDVLYLPLLDNTDGYLYLWVEHIGKPDAPTIVAPTASSTESSPVSIEITYNDPTGDTQAKVALVRNTPVTTSATFNRGTQTNPDLGDASIALTDDYHVYCVGRPEPDGTADTDCGVRLINWSDPSSLFGTDNSLIGAADHSRDVDQIQTGGGIHVVVWVRTDVVHLEFVTLGFGSFERSASYTPSVGNLTSCAMIDYVGLSPSYFIFHRDNTAGSGSAVEVWDYEDFHADVGPAVQADTLTITGASSTEFSAMAVSPDTNKVAVYNHEDRQVHIIDVTTRTAISLAGSWSAGTTYPYTSSSLVWLDNSYVCLVAKEDGLIILDVSTPSSISVAKNFRIADGEHGWPVALAYHASSSTLFAGYYHGGYGKIDMSTPSAPSMTFQRFTDSAIDPAYTPTENRNRHSSIAPSGDKIHWIAQTDQITYWDGV